MEAVVSFAKNRPLLLISLVLATVLPVPLALAEGPYVIGSSNTVTADPPISRPSTKPCIVQLFKDVAFDNFDPYNFTYTPPADCPGPWAKVVFEANISVTAGIQFDRTANFWIGGAAIYFGTTAEPSPTLGPAWHVESDLTDYSPLFTTTQSGQADIGNLVNSQYTGIIYATANLEFYPLAENQNAPVTADVVLPLSAGPDGGTVALNTTTDQLAATFSLPLNIERAYLDVYAQSQSNDEFWYTCVPNDVSGELFSCGNTAFRETEVSIDGTPAGVAPISPWIYTGGIDPFLWFPLPGVQTLNFIPYRVDLTPFAGLLSSALPHTVAISVYNADSYFSATASLLLYLDHGSPQVTGAVTTNTISSGPDPVITEKLNTDSNGDITGSVSVTSARQFKVAGYVDTSHGRVATTVKQSMNFSNFQLFDITSSVYVQNITQKSTVNTITTTNSNGASTQTSRAWSFPLTFDIGEAFNADGSGSLTSHANQDYRISEVDRQNGAVTYTSTLSNQVTPVDTLFFNSAGQITGNQGQSSTQAYTFSDSQNHCYDVTLSATNNALASFNSGCK